MKKILIYFTLIIAIKTTYAQEKKSVLTIGDSIPELKYSKWIKGTPINDFNDDKTYIFEFWATWCGPCIAVMPHLSEVAKSYAGKAEVIGVNVWEKVGNKPYESSLEKVINFVKGSGDRMTYHVIADNNDQYIANYWLKPAGIDGIPTTYIVKNGIIQWIGHPNSMDSVLATIVEGTHDLAGYKELYEEKNFSYRSKQDKLMKLIEEANIAAKSNDLDKAFNILDGLEAAQPNYKFMVAVYKFNMLLEFKSENDAMNLYYNQLVSNPSSSYIIAEMLIKSDKSFSDKMYNTIYESLNKLEQKMSALEILKADLLLKQGNKKSAREHIMTAISMAKEELNNPQFEGRIFPSTIDEYKEKLKLIK